MRKLQADVLEGAINPVRPRTKKDRRFRKQLRQVLDRHDWYLEPGRAALARRMLDELKYRGATLGDYGVWYITLKVTHMLRTGFARCIST